MLTPGSGELDRRNFRHVTWDAVGVGLANAAIPFLPIYLARLGASNFQVGLLTAMPAVTGLILSILIASFLQTRRNIVPWYAASRLVCTSAYALTGLAALFIPEWALILLTLAIWAVITLPQVVVSITFSVTMNAVAGPQRRLELMSRRWSILGITTSLGLLAAGQILTRIRFPTNYAVMFLLLSSGGLLSYLSSTRIRLPDQPPAARGPGAPLSDRIRGYMRQVAQHKPFLSQVAKRFVYISGTNLLAPLFPLFYVRSLQASDDWISGITTAQTVVLIFGYFFWLGRSRRQSSRWILAVTTLGMSIYPVMVALAHQQAWIAVLTGASGIFQAGNDLVLFDELMKTIPPEQSPALVAFDQTVQYVSTIIAPLLGTLLAGWIGLAGGLIAGGVIRFIGFAWFAWGDREPARQARVEVETGESLEG